MMWIRRGDVKVSLMRHPMLQIMMRPKLLI